MAWLRLEPRARLDGPWVRPGQWRSLKARGRPWEGGGCCPGRRAELSGLGLLLFSGVFYK